MRKIAMVLSALLIGVAAYAVDHQKFNTVTIDYVSGDGSGITNIAWSNIDSGVPTTAVGYGIVNGSAIDKLGGLNAGDLTNLTSASLVGDLPALNGAALTDLSAANITAAGTLPQLNAAALTALSAANITAAGTLPQLNAAALTALDAANITVGSAASAFNGGSITNLTAGNIVGDIPGTTVGGSILIEMAGITSTVYSVADGVTNKMGEFWAE